MKALTRNLVLVSTLIVAFLLSASFIDLRNDQFTFKGYYGTETLVSGKKYYDSIRGDSVSVDMLRFYVSNIELYEDIAPVARKRDCRLIDLFDSATCTFSIPYYCMSSVTEIRFDLGIDSATNVAGVGKDDLDPSKGMYWTWQSGYINLKVEGTSRLCKDNRGTFQYHIGGYSHPTNSLRKVVLKVEKNKGEFQVNVDVKKFLDQVDMRTLSHVMSPSDKSQVLANDAVRMFSLQK